jgi:3-oxoacyl-[acyl-carrier protein] reductase
MDLRLNTRRALVMGASRGLGRAIAAALKAEGATLAICAREGERLRAAAEAIGAKAIPCDLTKDGEGARVVADARRHLGGVDIMVVNTGGPAAGTFETLDDHAWRTGFEGLVMSAVQSIRAALPAMRAQRWGRIIVVTSVTAREPISTLAVSNVMRPALHGLINTLSKDVAADGVTLNAVMPGYCLTERIVEAGFDQAQLTTQIPARRLGKPEEIGALAAFLASDAAGYITGQAIACDGGLQRSI